MKEIEEDLHKQLENLKILCLRTLCRTDRFRKFSLAFYLEGAKAFFRLSHNSTRDEKIGHANQ